MALAHDVARRSLRGARTHRAGLRPGAAEHRRRTRRRPGAGHGLGPRRDEAAAENASRNGAAIETLVCDWAAPDALLARGPFQLVLASDVLYEQRNVDQLLDLLPRLVEERGRVLLADPGRAPAERFLESARATST